MPRARGTYSHTTTIAVSLGFAPDDPACPLSHSSTCPRVLPCPHLGFSFPSRGLINPGVNFTASQRTQPLSPVPLTYSHANHSCFPHYPDPYGSRAIIPVVRGRPRFPLLALQFAMDEGEEDNSTSNYDDEDSTTAAPGREWEEEQEEGNGGGSVRRCDYRVTCRALVLHPTIKYNRDLYLQKVILFFIFALTRSLLRHSTSTKAHTAHLLSFHFFPLSYSSFPTHNQKQSHALRRPRPTMETMPQDTLKLIFRFLPAPSLLASEMVCRLWRDLASKDDAHWEVRYVVGWVDAWVICLELPDFVQC